MRAARMYGYKEPLRIEEVSVPDPGPDDVLVKVEATGICRSDFQLVDGYFPFTLDFPYIPGHEIAGRVAQVGANVPASAGLSKGTLWSWTPTGVMELVGSAMMATSNCARVAGGGSASGRPEASRSM
jgi:D-arabinose 1-dehydrogenase-like Zn-dependent alcohol dehydrogenase